jgi:hypothetical protein
VAVQGANAEASSALSVLFQPASSISCKSRRERCTGRRQYVAPCPRCRSLDAKGRWRSGVTARWWQNGAVACRLGALSPSWPPCGCSRWRWRPAPAAEYAVGTLCCLAGKVVCATEWTSAAITTSCWNRGGRQPAKRGWSTSPGRTGQHVTWWRVTTIGSMGHDLPRTSQWMSAGSRPVPGRREGRRCRGQECQRSAGVHGLAAGRPDACLTATAGRR